MYRKEKQILISNLSTVALLVVYTLYVYFNYFREDPLLIHNTAFWAKAFLILIPVMMGMQILLHIILAIIYKIIANEEIPTITDEMDRLIELKAMRVSHWVFILGFILAMASQAFGMATWVMFPVLIGSMFMACIIEGMLQIWFYLKGV